MNPTENVIKFEARLFPAEVRRMLECCLGAPVSDDRFAKLLAHPLFKEALMEDVANLYATVASGEDAAALVTAGELHEVVAVYAQC